MEIYHRKLDLIEDCIKKLAQIKKGNPDIKGYRSSWKDKDSTERNLQKIIEAMIDIGKMLVAWKGLREPGSNREVFLILHENNLFPSEYLPLIDRMIGMRNILVHSYDRINDEVVYGVLRKNLKDIKKITSHLKKTAPTKSK